jgi:Rieske Fe-S protein
MDIDPTISRRTLLVAGAGGVGAVALAACSSGGTKSSGTDAVTSAAPQTSAATRSAATSTAAPAAGSSDDSGGADGSGGGSDNKDALISLDDIAVGKGAAVQLPNGKPAIVTRLTSSSAVCFSAICTHMGCTVAPKGEELDCPCHGSRFNIKTGAVLNGPASAPLAKIPVTVSDGKVAAS